MSAIPRSGTDHSVATGVVVTSPNGRVFRMGPTLLACAQGLLAGRDVEDVAARHGVNPGQVAALWDRLQAAGVTALTPVEERTQERRLRCRGISAVQLTLWQPGERFVGNARLWRRLTGPTALIVALSMAAVMTAVAVADSGVPLPHSIGLGQAALVLITVMFLTSLHELGHVFALGSHGLAPRRVGLMLFYGSLAMFSDVSPAWRLPDRRNQLLVIWWGSVVTAVELGATGLIARVTGWEVAALVFYGLISALLLNLIPLARFDGYYLLVIWRGHPRLRDECMDAVRARLRPIHGRTDAQASSGRRLLFGLVSVFYACLLWAIAIVGSIHQTQFGPEVSVAIGSPPPLQVYLVAAALFACFAASARITPRRLPRPAPSLAAQPVNTSGAVASPSVGRARPADLPVTLALLFMAVTAIAAAGL